MRESAEISERKAVGTQSERATAGESPDGAKQGAANGGAWGEVQRIDESELPQRCVE